MKRPYDHREDEEMSQAVHDDTVLAYGKSRTDAVTAPYTMEEISARIDEAENQITGDVPFLNEEVKTKMSALSPYSIVELNARIDEAERQIAKGEEMDADDFFAQVYQRIASKA